MKRAQALGDRQALSLLPDIVIGTGLITKVFGLVSRQVALLTLGQVIQ